MEYEVYEQSGFWFVLVRQGGGRVRVEGPFHDQDQADKARGKLDKKSREGEQTPAGGTRKYS